jgi:NAD(P)H-dependent FMN reductase
MPLPGSLAPVSWTPKPVAVVSAGTAGGPFARQMLIQTLTWQGAHVVAQIGIAAPRTKVQRGGTAYG